MKENRHFTKSNLFSDNVKDKVAHKDRTARSYTSQNQDAIVL